MNAIPTAEEAAREVIDRLPDQSTWHDIAYELYMKERKSKPVLPPLAVPLRMTR
jgi:hypothetical protein